MVSFHFLPFLLNQNKRTQPVAYFSMKAKLFQADDTLPLARKVGMYILRMIPNILSTQLSPVYLQQTLIETYEGVSSVFLKSAMAHCLSFSSSVELNLSELPEDPALQSFHPLKLHSYEEFVSFLLSPDFSRVLARLPSILAFVEGLEEDSEMAYAFLEDCLFERTPHEINLLKHPALSKALSKCLSFPFLSLPFPSLSLSFPFLFSRICT